MKNLIIIGAGDWGLEPFAWLEQAKGYKKEWTFKGFLDNNPNALKNVSFCNFPILGNEMDYVIQPNDVFICAIAQTDKKEAVVRVIEQKGGVFISLIHKSALFFKNVTIGKGCIISPNCVLSNNAQLGNHISLNLACTIGHDVKIGDYCQISSRCDITGHVSIGSRVFLGSSVSIIPKIKIGNDVTIGVGSVVLKGVKDGLSVFGNPAKIIL